MSYLETYKLVRAGERATGLSLAQAAALEFLATTPGVTMAGFANGMGMGNGTATVVVDGLEVCGYLQRVRSATDRRAIHLHLTDAGLHLAQRLTAA